MLHLVGDLFELNVKIRCQKVNMQTVCPSKEIFFALYFVVLMTSRSMIFWRSCHEFFFFEQKSKFEKFVLRPFRMCPNLMILYCFIFQTAALLICLHDSMATEKVLQKFGSFQKGVYAIEQRWVLFIHGATLHVVMDDHIALKWVLQAIAQFQLMYDNVVVFTCRSFHNIASRHSVTLPWWM